MIELVTSSQKITAGRLARATLKSVRTSFSPSPIHLELREAGLMLKKAALAAAATQEAGTGEMMFRGEDKVSRG